MARVRVRAVGTERQPARRRRHQRQVRVDVARVERRVTHPELVEPRVVDQRHQLAEPVGRLGSHQRDADAHAHRATRRHSADCQRSEEHTSELQSRLHLVCRLLLEKKKKTKKTYGITYEQPYTTCAALTRLCYRT